jgi:hypothetical protein
VIVATRIFVVGGLTSFRALWYWLTPWIYVPTMLVAPIFQILLFAYIGRSAGLESDKFYLIGNALQYASIPCLFAMAQMIGGERFQNTLSAILVSPAPRVPLAASHPERRLRRGVLARGRRADPRRPPAGELAGPARADRSDRRLLVHRARPDQRRGQPADPRERRAEQRHLRLPADLHRRERPARRAP